MRRTFEKTSEIFAFTVLVLVFAAIGIFSFFLLAYLIIGAIGMVIGIMTGAVIIVLGIRRTIIAYKKEGTMYLLTRSAASPEVDNKGENSK